MQQLHRRSVEFLSIPTRLSKIFVKSEIACRGNRHLKSGKKLVDFAVFSSKEQNP